MINRAHKLPSHARLSSSILAVARFITNRALPIEAQIKGLSASECLSHRQLHGKPKFEAFEQWAKQQLEIISGKGDLAKAFRYILSRRAAFTLFLEDGRVVNDNNVAERAMKPIAVGRKN